MKAIAIDFDGVMNDYTGWKGATNLGNPRPGLAEFLTNLRALDLRVVIHTTRIAELVWEWLEYFDLSYLVSEVSDVKPLALCYIDDRAVCFTGSFDEAYRTASVFKAYWEEQDAVQAISPDS